MHVFIFLSLLLLLFVVCCKVSIRWPAVNIFERKEPTEKKNKKNKDLKQKGGHFASYYFFISYLFENE